jgi:hypothetical protein
MLMDLTVIELHFDPQSDVAGVNQVACMIGSVFLETGIGLFSPIQS